MPTQDSQALVERALAKFLSLEQLSVAMLLWQEDFSARWGNSLTLYAFADALAQKLKLDAAAQIKVITSITVESKRSPNPANLSTAERDDTTALKPKAALVAEVSPQKPTTRSVTINSNTGLPSIASTNESQSAAPTLTARVTRATRAATPAESSYFALMMALLHHFSSLPKSDLLAIERNLLQQSADIAVLEDALFQFRYKRFTELALSVAVPAPKEKSLKLSVHELYLTVLDQLGPEACDAKFAAAIEQAKLRPAHLDYPIQQFF